MSRPEISLRDRWLDAWHALPRFRGRDAVARFIAERFLASIDPIAWAKLPNGLRLKLDVRWKGYDDLYYFRTYEPALTALTRAALDVDGAEFVDVGANIGVFCVLAADVLRRRGGHALAVEPLQQNLDFLTASLAANGLSDLIDVAPVAVGDAEGTLELEVMAPGEIANARPTTWSEGATAGSRVVSIPMTTLDAIASGRRNVQFVKIDVEGAELFVLRGAVELLRRERPLVYCEFHKDFMAANGTTFADVVAFAGAADYVVQYLGTTGRIVAAPPDPSSRFHDIVLVPREPSPHQRMLTGER